MGRNPKITAEEILDFLINQGQATNAEMAKYFKVTVATIKKRIRELRVDGEAIIHDKNGLLHITKESLDDADIAESLRIFIDWELKLIKGFVICSEPTRPLLPTLRKNLKESLTSEERKALGTACIKIKALLDYIEAQEEF